MLVHTFILLNFTKIGRSICLLGLKSKVLQTHFKSRAPSTLTYSFSKTFCFFENHFATGSGCFLTLIQILILLTFIGQFWLYSKHDKWPRFSETRWIGQNYIIIQNNDSQYCYRKIMDQQLHVYQCSQSFALNAMKRSVVIEKTLLFLWLTLTRWTFRHPEMSVQEEKNLDVSLKLQLSIEGRRSYRYMLVLDVTIRATKV